MKIAERMGTMQLFRSLSTRLPRLQHSGWRVVWPCLFASSPLITLIWRINITLYRTGIRFFSALLVAWGTCFQGSRRVFRRWRFFLSDRLVGSRWPDKYTHTHTRGPDYLNVLRPDYRRNCIHYLTGREWDGRRRGNYFYRRLFIGQGVTSARYCR